MKSMLKSELAREASVSVRTLNRWCEVYREELIAMGWRPRMKLMPPKVVAFIVETFCIDITETDRNGQRLTKTDRY